MNCDHDWMRMGSREVCLKCNKARMRKDLPAWEVKHGQVVRSSAERPTVKANKGRKLISQ